MLEIIILAAGRGTRMRSTLPKVLHGLAGRPLVAHVLATARKLEPNRIHLVVGHGADQVRAALSSPDLVFHHQAEQLGTGHAVLQALPACLPDSTVLVLFGDVPLIQTDDLMRVVAAGRCHPTVLAATLSDPTGYGRIVRDPRGYFSRVVEQKDASLEQLAIQEVNTGVIAAPSGRLLQLLRQVGNANQQAEYYLPDVLGLAQVEGDTVSVVATDDPMAIRGVNDRLQLEALERDYQRAQAERLLLEGVGIRDKRRIDIRGDLRCGTGINIDVNVVFEGDVNLGDDVHIGAHCVLKDCTIGSGTVIHPFTYIDQATIGRHCSIGPYARLRPGSQLADAARIGNFVETKNAQFGNGSKANHLAYIGDTVLGAGCNVGAGTITCNYDGVAKHKTHMGNRVFVGSNSTLVAPLDLADDSFVAAGSTVTRDVADGDLAVGRAKQRNIQGWQRPGKNQES